MIVISDTKYGTEPVLLLLNFIFLDPILKKHKVESFKHLGDV